MNEILSIQDRGAEQGSRCLWSVPCNSASFIEVSDEYWSATFGAAQLSLAETNEECLLILDFTRVEWVDPLPLLSLFLVVKQFCARTNSSLQIKLGSSKEGGSRRLGFLQFLRQHGFAESLFGSYELEFHVNGAIHSFRE